MICIFVTIINDWHALVHLNFLLPDCSKSCNWNLQKLERFHVVSGMVLRFLNIMNESYIPVTYACIWKLTLLADIFYADDER